MVSESELAPVGVAPPTTTERRLETTTAATMTSTAPSAMSTRTVVSAPSPTCSPTTAGAMSSATRFITLISGLIAGPAVSLNGSPTVSPMTVAAWASLPLPPYSPSSTIFFALSQAPPEFARKTAISVPAAIAPTR